MKFTQNTPVISPGVISARVQSASNDPMAYGMAGKNYEAMAGAFGQMAKLAKEKQDDIDAADLMEARNKIMGSITANMYGENGLLTTGVGENAKGLEERVTQTVQKTFDDVSQNYNKRVQRALRGNLNENMANYQRIAAQQEGREFQKQKDNQYGISIQNSQNLVMNNLDNLDLLQSTLNDTMRIVDYRAKDQGWNEAQKMQERRSVLTSVVGGYISANLNNENFENADIALQRYGKDMNQKDIMQYQKALRQEKQTVAERDEMDELAKTILTPTGEPDWTKIEDEIKRRAKETKTVEIGGGGGNREGAANAWVVYDMYKSAGYDDNAIAGILGRLQQEHNFSTDMAKEWDAPGIGRVGGFGMFQLQMDPNYGGRGIDLQNWAKENGFDPYDAKTQTQHSLIEAKKLGVTPERMNGKTPEEAADIWRDEFEIGKPGKERQYAREWLERIKKASKSSTPVSFEKLDPEIDASGVDLTGTKPRTIGMVNYARQLYKQLSGKDDFWLSCTTGGHDPDTTHGRGDGADVGGSALKDPEILEKFLAGMRAAGAGANDEYNHKSPGWTGPHVDLKANGDNWQTGEDFGGFQVPAGGGGGGGRVVNLHDSGYEGRMIKRMEAMRSDYARRKSDETNSKLQAYWQQIQGTGSASQALEILYKANSSEDYQVANAVESMVSQKYRGVFNKGRSTEAGSGRSRARMVQGQNSGEWYTMAQYKAAKRRFAIWEKTSGNTDRQQASADEDAALINDVEGNSGDNLDSAESLELARHAVEVTANDEEAEWYLIVNGKFSETEAKHYVQLAHND